MAIVFPPNLRSESQNIPFVSFNIMEFRDRNSIADRTKVQGYGQGGANAQQVSATTNDSQSSKLLSKAGGKEGEELPNIYLPLPTSISNSYDPSWSIDNLKLLEGVRNMAAAYRGGSGVMDSLMKAGMSGAGAMYGGFGMSDTLKNITGYTPNPMKQPSFDSIDPRKFTFNYAMAPQNEREANIIQKIVETFTKAALPSIKDLTKAFVKFPCEFQIEFHNVKGFPKPTFCVCTGVNVGYDQSGINILPSGHTTQTTLSLSFTEVDIRTREDCGL